MHGQLNEWDVLNEAYAHHNLMDILGRDAMVDWFREAHAGAPGVKLFYNDYTMFRGSGPDSPSQSFYDTAKFLKDKGAPIDAIGEQGHFGGSPAGPPEIIADLDQFAKLGLPIQISEFDIDTDDTSLQADYMRDLMTAVFSHPSVIGVVQWGFWERSHWLPRAALWDKNWKLRPHGQVWVDLTTKTWWTNADGHSQTDGSYGVRGFYGDYEVTVTRGLETKTVNFSLTPQNRSLIIALH